MATRVIVEKHELAPDKTVYKVILIESGKRRVVGEHALELEAKASANKIAEQRSFAEKVTEVYSVDVVAKR